MRPRILISTFLLVTLFAGFFHLLAAIESRRELSEAISVKPKFIVYAMIGEIALPKPREETRVALATSPSPSSDGALEIAHRYLVEHRAELGIQPHHELRGQVSHTPLLSKVEYKIYEDGIFIEGISLVVNIRDGAVSDVENTYRPLPPGNTGDAAPVEEILELLSSQRNLVPDGDVIDRVSTIFLVNASDRVPQLAYTIPVRDAKSPSKVLEVTVRASDGQVLRRTHGRSEF